VTFDPNPDGYRLDQHLDFIRSVQLFRNGDEVIVELWGHTAVVAPSGDRVEGREFQQNAVVGLSGGTDYPWNVTRWVYQDDTYSVAAATTFELSGKGSTSRHRI
jgi:hypothetical protein